MKKANQIFYTSVIVILLAACNISSYEPATTALEGGREFIDACLKGDFKKAGFYMIEDSTNSKALLKIKRDYDFKPAEERRNYEQASIIINSDEAIDDSTHIINYSNSYDKITRKVKVLNHNGKWLVDFKYTFSGNL